MAICKESSKCFRKIIIAPFLLIINIYRYCISPFIPARCRYFPTCSEYSIEALQTHGILKGLYLTIRRLSRCHPLCKRDYFDPVPEKKKV